MPGSSTGSFTDTEEYKASFTGIFAEFTPIGPGAFAAHVDRTELQHMHLLQARESIARVAYFAFPPDLVFISFSADPRLPLIWRGAALGTDEIMLHARGEHVHQRTDGPSRWSLIALSPSALAGFCKAETGSGLTLPTSGRIIRPPPRDRKSLLRVHRQAAHLAETRPAVVGHPEVVRAMESELAGLLIRCLTDGEVGADSASTLGAADIMQRFESALANCPLRGSTAAEMAAELGVSPRALHEYCLAFLGVSPRRYVQLRQLTHARAAIRRADPRAARISELARSAGFTERHFADLYRAVFGETPTTTLRRAGEA